jgi:hypothetical protein
LLLKKIEELTLYAIALNKKNEQLQKKLRNEKIEIIMKKIVLMLFAILTIACGCNKTKQTLKKIYGDYTLISYTVNGVDSLSLYKDSLGINFKFSYNDYRKSNLCVIYGPRNDNVNSSLVIDWGLIDKNTLKFYSSTDGNSIGIGPFGTYKTTEWIILSLNNEFKMKTNYNGKEYFIELH